ncbi:hypothetical protein COO60DRAFT_1643815 [Scenedesmus sp. NREL 46B-D3]|nr:hypothetical protein COO60DRAFT_1643815 [Scenedesmus sp. NREL 46B-D3]
MAAAVAASVDILTICNAGESVTCGAGTSSFVVRLRDVLRHVGRVQLFALAAEPDPSITYVRLSVRELGIDEWPVFYRCMQLNGDFSTNGFLLECMPDWHAASHATPLGLVDRLSVHVTRPDGSALGSTHVTLLLKVAHTPRLAEAPLLQLQRSPKQAGLLMLDMACARGADGVRYEFVVPLDEPLYSVDAVRLLDLRMPPVFVSLPRRAWEPYVHVEIEELGIRSLSASCRA